MPDVRVIDVPPQEDYVEYGTRNHYPARVASFERVRIEEFFENGSFTRIKYRNDEAQADCGSGRVVGDPARGISLDINVPGGKNATVVWRRPIELGKDGRILRGDGAEVTLSVDGTASRLQGYLFRIGAYFMGCNVLVPATVSSAELAELALPLNWELYSKADPPADPLELH